MSKIKGTQTIFIGNSEKQIGNIGRNETEKMTRQKLAWKSKNQGSNIFAGNLKEDISGTIKQKKALARKQAAKVISDKFEADNVSSDMIKELDVHKEELKKQAEAANSQLNYLKEEKEKLKEVYGITEDYATGSNGEYEERLAALLDETDYWKERKEEALADIAADGQTIEAIKQSKLGQKYTMKNAMEQAEEILDAASEEVVGLLRKEAMDHVKEEQEEKLEQAEEAAEEKEEQEEKLEKIKEEKKEQSNRTKKLHDLLKKRSQIQEKVGEIRKAADLLEEDMKGLLIDENIC